MSNAVKAAICAVTAALDMYLVVFGAPAMRNIYLACAVFAVTGFVIFLRLGSPSDRAGDE